MFSEGSTRKIVGLILAIICSLVLVPFLVITPLYSAFMGLFSAENISTVLKTVDYTEVVKDNLEISEEDKNTAEIINTVMKTEAVGDMLELYIQDLNNVSKGQASNGFNEAAINSILTENSSAIVDELVKNPNINMSREELQQEVNTVIAEHSDDIVDLLPPVDQMADVFEENDMNFATFSAQGTITNTMYMVLIVVASLIIFFAKIYRLKGLVVLGIDYIIGAILSFGVSALLGMDAVVDSLNAETGGFGDVFLNMSNDIRTWSITIGVLAIVFLLVGIIGGKICKNVELSRTPAQATNPYANPAAGQYNNGMNNNYNNMNNNNNYTGI